MRDALDRRINAFDLAEQWMIIVAGTLEIGVSDGEKRTLLGAGPHGPVVMALEAIWPKGTPAVVRRMELAGLQERSDK